MKKTKFPPGWDEQRVRRVLEHYEQQTDDQAVAEDEAAYEDSAQTLMEVPTGTRSHNPGTDCKTQTVTKRLITCIDMRPKKRAPR